MKRNRQNRLNAARVLEEPSRADDEESALLPEEEKVPGHDSTFTDANYVESMMIRERDYDDESLDQIDEQFEQEMQEEAVRPSIIVRVRGEIDMKASLGNLVKRLVGDSEMTD